MRAIRSTSIRDYCKACVGDDRPRDCELTKCDLYRYRMGGEDKTMKGYRKTRGEAIKSFCRQCMCNRTAINCCAPSCVLFPFRV